MGPHRRHLPGHPQLAAIESARRRMERSDLRLRLPDGKEVTLGSVTRGTSKRAPECAVLFGLARQFRPNRCLELGTSVGISGAYQAAALHLNEHGVLISLDLREAVVEQARILWNSLGLDRAEIVLGRFADTLPGVLADQACDYAFIDGHHQEGPTLAYFRAIADCAPRGCVLVFDDIHWSPGMERAWARIVTDPAVAEYADLGWLGIVLLDADGSPSGSAR
jgi:predicted O-methyltransferase YrrM